MPSIPQTFVALLACVSLTWGWTPSDWSSNPTVDIDYAVIQGTTNAATGINEFLGFKYASRYWIER